jgi:glycosyltransferase involved in cell wall biosynthesis
MPHGSSSSRAPGSETAAKLLSVVVPCFNEEEVLRETHRRLLEALQPLDTELEIVYVDDGSRDGTGSILQQLSASDPRVRVVRFARNFGHQTAVTAGIDHSRGDAVVLIDADLQDPPEVIPRMVALWREGYQVVYGVRAHRPGETLLKRSTAAAFYRMINLMSDVPIPLDTGDFRLMDRCVADVLRDMPERHRFVRGMVSWVGFRQCPIYYERHPRFAGESKYPLSKMLRFALDGVTSFSTVPLRWATWAGLVAAGISLLGIVYALVTRLMTNSWVPGWAAIFVAVLFVGGVQLLSLGAIGEYVGRIYSEAKGRPLYVVAERLGFALLESRSPSVVFSNAPAAHSLPLSRGVREMYTPVRSGTPVTAAPQEPAIFSTGV